MVYTKEQACQRLLLTLNVLCQWQGIDTSIARDQPQEGEEEEVITEEQAALAAMGPMPPGNPPPQVPKSRPVGPPNFKFAKRVKTADGFMEPQAKKSSSSHIGG